MSVSVWYWSSSHWLVSAFKKASGRDSLPMARNSQLAHHALGWCLMNDLIGASQPPNEIGVPLSARSEDMALASPVTCPHCTPARCQQVWTAGKPLALPLSTSVVPSAPWQSAGFLLLRLSALRKVKWTQ